LEVARQFLQSRPEVQVIIVGDGIARAELQSAAAAGNLTNVLFKPLQPLAKFSALLAMADVHLVLQRKGAADLVMPSKLTGIWAAGGAVLATSEAGTALYEVITSNNLGMVVAPDLVPDLISGLEHLLDHPELCRQFRTQCRAYVEQELAREVVLTRFHNELIQLVQPIAGPEKEPVRYAAAR
jgi:colanic acid biosynthesis glycosyl transferase WcaI